jgi:pectate lyase-like protein
MSRVALTELIFKNTSPVSVDRNATVYVYVRGTETQATLYANDAGESVLAQPLTTDTGGRPEKNGVQPWVEPGSYDLSVSGQTFPWEAVSGEAGNVVSVNALGAKADGTTDNFSVFKKAKERLDVLGGGTLQLGPGTYLTSPFATTLENIAIVGAGVDATTIKLKDGGESHALNFSGSGYRLEHFTLDGNRDGNLVAGHGIRFWGEDILLQNLRVEKTRTYGIAIAQDEYVKRIRLRNIDIRETGRDGLDCKNHTNTNADCFIENCTADTIGLNGDHGEAGFDFRGPWHAKDLNARGMTEEDVGIRFRESDGGTTGYGCKGASLSGFSIELTSTCTNALGLSLAEGVSASNGYVNGNEGIVTAVTGASHCTAEGIVVEKCANAGGGIGFWQPVAHSYTTFVSCHAIKCKTGFFIVGTNAVINDGVAKECTQYGVDPSTSTGLQIGVISYSGNATDLNGGTVAAANALTLPSFTDSISISGATEIKKISASRSGRRVTLIFASNPKVVDGENLKLKGNLEATADTTLTLVCNSIGNWFEVSRSVN